MMRKDGTIKSARAENKPNPIHRQEWQVPGQTGSERSGGVVEYWGSSTPALQHSTTPSSPVFHDSRSYQTSAGQDLESRAYLALLPVASP